jgi:hypothetical protein
VEKQMAVPPRGDPRRPLHLAIRSTRVLAIIFLLFGTCASIPLLITGGMARRGGMFLNAGILFLYVGPGAVYLVTAIYLKRRQFWAVVVGLVMASIQSLFVLLAIAGILITMVRQPGSSIVLIPMGVLIFIILALAQLIYHLALSFDAIKYAPVEEQHGFEPLMAQPVEPPKAPEGE